MHASARQLMLAAVCRPTGAGRHARRAAEGGKHSVPPPPSQSLSLALILPLPSTPPPSPPSPPDSLTCSSSVSFAALMNMPAASALRTARAVGGRGSGGKQPQAAAASASSCRRQLGLSATPQLGNKARLQGWQHLPRCMPRPPCTHTHAHTPVDNASWSKALAPSSAEACLMPSRRRCACSCGSVMRRGHRRGGWSAAGRVGSAPAQQAAARSAACRHHVLVWLAARHSLRLARPGQAAPTWLRMSAARSIERCMTRLATAHFLLRPDACINQRAGQKYCGPGASLPLGSAPLPPCPGPGSVRAPLLGHAAAHLPALPHVEVSYKVAFCHCKPAGGGGSVAEVRWGRRVRQRRSSKINLQAAARSSKFHSANVLGCINPQPAESPCARRTELSLHPPLCGRQVPTRFAHCRGMGWPWRDGVQAVSGSCCMRRHADASAAGAPAPRRLCSSAAGVMPTHSARASTSRLAAPPAALT